MPFSSRFLGSINEISRESWQQVAGTDYPFLRHEFLAALEDSGSVSPRTGWQPKHLLIEENGQLVAVMPLYLKTHSWGEYVFDWSWADAYQRHGLAYYPKLLAAIPFTPATGPRLCLKHPQADAVADFTQQSLQQHCLNFGASGWHVLFTDDTENTLWQTGDAAQRIGCQFHWFNQGFHTFDDFLATFSSRKRKNLKKERQRVADQGVQLERLTGEQITEAHWARFYYFYQITYARHSGHGGYLTEDFFHRLFRDMRDSMLLVTARQSDEIIAGALNFFSSDTLYGRYWGAIRDIDCLHFEACYYQGIEFCIERGLQRFDPGAQGEHKIQRGFTPILTHSWHWLANPDFDQAVKRFMQEEALHIRHYREQAKTLLPFKQQ